MKKNYGYSVNFNDEIEKAFKNSIYLGQGNNGIVYDLGDNKIIKIFLKAKVCNAEKNILEKTKKSKYFPKMYKSGELYIIREKVNGIRLDKYIKRNGLDKEMVLKIYDLFKEFRKLKFKKIDTRCRDIYVTEDLELKLIDPKGFYTRKVDFPRHFMKKLNRLRQLTIFFQYMTEINPKEAKYWKTSLNKYFKNNNIEYLL